MPCVLYRFPKNKELREKWMDFCGIDEKVLNSATKLCSIHFEEDAIIRRKNRAVAKVDAVPCTIIKKRQFPKADKDVYMYWKNSSAQGKMCTICILSLLLLVHDVLLLLFFFFEWIVSDTLINEFFCRRHYDIVALDQPSTSKTSGNVECLQTPKKSYQFPRYVGDIRSPHFATPRRAKRTFDVVKVTVRKQQMTIKSLKQRQKRLLNRIKTMEGMIQHLKNRQLLDESTSDNILLQGFVDMGLGVGDSAVPLTAKHALVFMLVALNGHWKLPIGYFLIDSLSGKERASLLEHCLQLVHETGAMLHWPSSNLLGCPARKGKKKKIDALWLWFSLFMAAKTTA
ncbi:THAP domain-containing protein 9 [Cyphomyrmex costatus]|uniref:THAP domain-containing protein 9 n=1 Tax=Cyphomyrmex costatus TaxID=456900 RepID=A0A151IN93_9HYME|nr:THAP domain-containing protein 9 [Cyphomyrmex costatus]